MKKWMNNRLEAIDNKKGTYGILMPYIGSYGI